MAGLLDQHQCAEQPRGRTRPPGSMDCARGDESEIAAVDGSCMAFACLAEPRRPARFAGSALAFELVQKIAVWVHGRVEAVIAGPGGMALWQKVLLVEWGGMNDVLYNLYEQVQPRTKQPFSCGPRSFL
jgi:hypothetical protein